MQSFWLALQFLTRLPTPQMAEVEPAAVGRSLLYYPLVGLIIGAILLMASQLAATLSVTLLAALLLALWVFLSGALHIDGLADMADAWVGGHGDRERTLAIMKDPYCGPMGVTAVVVMLLLKYAALLEIAGHPEILLALPVLGRGFTLLLILTTPYCREQGLASDMVKHLPRIAAWLVLATVALLFLWWLQLVAFSMLAVSLIVFFLFRRALMQRLQGFTGDAAGALIEIVEVVVLLVAVVIAGG